MIVNGFSIDAQLPVSITKISRGSSLSGPFNNLHSSFESQWLFNRQPLNSKHYRDFERLLLQGHRRIPLQFSIVFHDTQWFFDSHLVTCKHCRNFYRLSLLWPDQRFLLQLSLIFRDIQWLFDSHSVTGAHFYCNFHFSFMILNGF